MSDADEVAELKYEAAKWKRAHDAVGEKVIEVCEENARLKAEVERLRKAGDAMEQRLLLWHDDDYSSIWNAAKEGKQS